MTETGPPGAARKARRAGAWAETLACEDLESRGLRLLERNFQLKCGELDLIMRDTDCVVFVEVRYRASNRWGGGSASVTPAKQRRLIRTAHAYLKQRPALKTLPCRFDVYAVTGHPGEPEVDWIRNAFTSS